jgi:hypothetical protein
MSQMGGQEVNLKALWEVGGMVVSEMGGWEVGLKVLWGVESTLMSEMGGTRAGRQGPIGSGRQQI